MILTLSNTSKKQKRFFIESNKATLRNFDGEVWFPRAKRPTGSDSVILLADLMSNRVTINSDGVFTNKN